MSQTRPRVLVAACGALLAAGCSSAPTAPASPSTDPVTTTAPDQAALNTYREFWRVIDAARAAPRSQDWTPKIKALATGQALQSALTRRRELRQPARACCRHGHP